jgi:lipopolysaccharide transport system permease protein
MIRALTRGGREFWSGLRAAPLWMMLVRRHVRLTYRASKLGMFWATLPLGAQMLVTGVVYGRLTDAPFAVILPWIATGLIAWQFLGHFVNQALHLFGEYAGLIRNSDHPHYTYLIAAFAISALQALHNLVLLVAVAAIVGFHPRPEALWLVPGIVMFALAVGWLGMPLAISALRFPMASNVVGAVLNLAFVVTPILFMPSALQSAAWIVDLNPLTHVIALLREPLLGRVPSSTSMMVALALAAAGWIVALAITGRWRDRIAYWV